MCFYSYQNLIVKSQLENPSLNVFTGKAFGVKDEESQLKFEDMITIDGAAISSAFGMNISVESITGMLTDYLSGALSGVEVDTTQAQQDFLDTLRIMGVEMLQGYVSAHADESGRAGIPLDAAASIASGYCFCVNDSYFI